MIGSPSLARTITASTIYQSEVESSERPWPQRRPRGHILKSLALASKVKSLALASSPRKLACPRLEDSSIF